MNISSNKYVKKVKIKENMKINESNYRYEKEKRKKCIQNRTAGFSNFTNPYNRK